MIRSLRPTWLTTGALALLVAIAACSHDAAGPAGNQARMTVQLASVSTASAGALGARATLGGIPASDFGGLGGFGDFGDGMGHHWHGWWGWARASKVDSLIVTATKLEVLTAVSDSEDAADSIADSVSAASGGSHGDDDGDDWEQREFGWTQLPILGDGHLDLMHLPDSAAAGLPVATGTLPAGRYRRVRLFITDPMIYFDSLIVTPAGDTLMAGAPNGADPMADCCCVAAAPVPISERMPFGLARSR